MTVGDTPKVTDKMKNLADDFPSSRPGPKTTSGFIILLVGGLAIYYW
jgi:hypothetical protein